MKNNYNNPFNLNINNNFPQNNNNIPFGYNFNQNQKKNNLKYSYNPNISQPSEEMKKELEIENKIRDRLKCSICLTKVMKPKMCRFCKNISCQACIDNHLKNHDFCNKCKHKVIAQDMITLPFLDDLSSYFIHNIDNHPKLNQDNNNQELDNRSIIIKKKYKEKNNNINYNQQNNISNQFEEKIEICPIHKNKVDYYCIQCDKYFCSNCLVFFGEEVKKHQKHLILQISKMKSLGIKDAVDEYRKLPKTKNEIDNLLGIISFKLKENEVKKAEVRNFMNLIRDKYLEKMDENSNELNTIIVGLRTQKNSIDNFLNSADGLNKSINNNENFKSSSLLENLKNNNRIDENVENDIKDKLKINPKLFVEYYETKIIEINIPYRGQYNEGLEIFNKNIDIIPNFPSRLVMQFLQNKVHINYCVDIDLPLNAINYPKFYNYIIFKNKDFVNKSLEFINLSNQAYLQKQNENNHKRISQQINSNEIDAQKFLILSGEEKIIRIKVYIIKIYYQ